MSVYKLYSIDDLCLRVSCGDKWIAEKIPNLLKALGFVDGKRTPSNTKISVEFTAFDNHDKKIKLDQSTYLHSFGPLGFFQDDGYLYVTEGKSFLGVDLRTSSGLAILDNSFWQKPLYLKASLLIVGFILLFWQYDFHELHAAGLAKDRKGLLIVGPSGSGKSTLTLSLVRAGWRYLTDDMLILQHTSHGVEALPLRRYFKVDQALISKCPELAHLLDKPLEFLDNETYIYVDEVYGDQLTQRCKPRAIIFPRITHQEKSQIEPIKQSEAFISLFRSNCYGMHFDDRMTRRRLGIMKELLCQADCYQMLLGLDFYEDPGKILELLPRW